MAQELTVEQVYDRNVSADRLKHGTKYEQLTAFVFQHLDQDSAILHDVRLRGDGKATVHQIDVHVTRGSDSRRAVIECRDKAPGNNVTLAEARSFATVVRHLGALGIMVTTTGFTAGAVKLTQDEDLELLTLRPFTDEDTADRLKAIDVVIQVVMPVPVHVAVELAGPSPDGAADTSQILPMDSAIVSGSPRATLRDLLGDIMEAPLRGEHPAGQQKNSRSFSPPVVLATEDGPLHIERLSVTYRVERGEQALRVDAGSRIAELVLQSLDQPNDRVIWDRDLQRYIVDPSTRRVIDR